MSGGVMDEREASVASSTDFYESDKKPDTPAADAHDDLPPAKRKAQEVQSSPEKRRKLESPPAIPSIELKPCAGLSPALWQHIFLFCSLPTLGRLLQVNRSFHSYLTNVRNVSAAKPESGFLRLLKSESLWASARNMHPSKPPKPLPGFSELQMWQLAWSSKCQFCGKESAFVPGEKIWQKGPGARGVRIIWPFGIRACGSCLLERCRTDSNLLFSNASALRPALPYAFVTSDQNYIPAYTLQAATTPANVEIIKYYYKYHVDEISKELDDALSLGSAAAEEWSKGLDARGKERMKVAENWERWEVKYEWWRAHQEPTPVTRTATTSPSQPPPPPRRTPPPHITSPIIHAPVPASKYRSIHAVAQGVFTLPHQNISAPAPAPALTTAAPPSQHGQARPLTIPPPVCTPQLGTDGGAQGFRGERNLHDANEAKANRKLEIERRCQLLKPPIPPNILRHMESFKAAIQISQPMNEYAWSVLHPRLLSQFPAAQQAENDHVSRVASLTTRTADRRQQDASLKEVKEVLDREWEESQRPIRERLNAIADDFINQNWDHGRAVTSDNSPKFAVDLLMYVRRRFYEEVAENGPTLEGADPQTPILVLENMKWVYDNKLKPLTEQFRKELFLCYGNGCEGNYRFYGFEGVIQHFGAKHTNTFSVGNVVVAWREAEWPEETPFHPDPVSVKHSHHSSSNSGSHAQSGYGSYYGGYSRAGTSTPHMQPHLPQASPGPYGYAGQYNGPFAPPLAGTVATSSHDYSQLYGVPADPHAYQQMGPPSYGPHPTSHSFRTSPAMSNAAIAPPPVIQAQNPGAKELSGQSNTANGEYRKNLYEKQVSTIIEVAQDIWKQTSGIKDFPNSLRVYVLLHRIISKFHVEFNHEPNLNHFVDALSNHEIPKALKYAPGLFCKACQDDPSGHQSVAYPPRPEERRAYTALNLFSHFQSQHGGPQYPRAGSGQSSTVLDWKEDMIELPSDRFISGLIHAPGMDDDKLRMIATVFPKQFPTPLPRIGTVDNDGRTSPAHSVSKDFKGAIGPAGTPGLSNEKSGPSSLGSPYTASPRPPKPSEDEYDPQRPALLASANQPSRTGNKIRLHRGSPPTDRRSRFENEPRYYLPHDALDDDFGRAHEYMEIAPSPRFIRNSGHVYRDNPGRRPFFQDSEAIYDPDKGEVVFAHPRERFHPQDYETYPREVRYIDDDARRAEYRLRRDPRSQENSPTSRRAEADRFLEELASGQSFTNKAPEPDAGSRTTVKPSGDTEPDDGSRYTPPPPNAPSADDQPERPSSLAAAPAPTAASTISNGSRYEEHRSGVRQVPTPDPGSSSRRNASHRRRDRPHDYVPSRYYRYMSVAHDESYPRGTSMNRSQSKRYERYEQQRRRIDQQETPQPNVERDYEPAYSRDQSVDQGYPDDPYPVPIRAAPREYIPIQDHLHPLSPPRYRYAGPPEDTRGPPSVYVDEYGRHLQEYEVIRVPRDARPARAPYPPARYNSEHDSEHLQYVPVSYDRPPLQRYNSRPAEYVYYEERPPPARRPAFDPESEASYEPPPEIKVEAAPAPEGP